MAGDATRTFPARTKRNNHPVAGVNPHHFPTDAFNDSRAFVPEYGWKIDAEHSVAGSYVSVAHAAGHNADQGLIGPRVIEVNVLKYEPGARRGHNGSTGAHRHGAILSQPECLFISSAHGEHQGFRIAVPAEPDVPLPGYAVFASLGRLAGISNSTDRGSCLRTAGTVSSLIVNFPAEVIRIGRKSMLGL
jgi:hypothetical protein